jgi:toxin FitB
MIILDTNVVSELRRPYRADAAVVRWAAEQPLENLYLSVISIWEIERGIRIKLSRDPVHANVLRSWLDGIVVPRFAGRILNFDLAAALRCGSISVANCKVDRDAMIAATALVHGMQVATRNTSDFASTGVSLINPWLVD